MPLTAVTQSLSALDLIDKEGACSDEYHDTSDIAIANKRGNLTQSCASDRVEACFGQDLPKRVVRR